MVKALPPHIFPQWTAAQSPAANKHLPSGACTAVKAPCLLSLHYWKCQDKNGPKDFCNGSEKDVLFLLLLPAGTRCRAGGAGYSDLWGWRSRRARGRGGV